MTDNKQDEYEICEESDGMFLQWMLDLFWEHHQETLRQFNAVIPPRLRNDFQERVNDGIRGWYTEEFDGPLPIPREVPKLNLFDEYEYHCKSLLGKLTIEDMVLHAIGNALDNGYDVTEWESHMIARDIKNYDAAFKDIPVGDISEAVIKLRKDGKIKPKKGDETQVE